MGLSIPICDGRQSIGTHLYVIRGSITIDNHHAKPLGIETVPDRCRGWPHSLQAGDCKAHSTSHIGVRHGWFAVLDSDFAQLPATLKVIGKSFAGAGFGSSALGRQLCSDIYRRPGTCRH